MIKTQSRLVGRWNCEEQIARKEEKQKVLKVFSKVEKNTAPFYGQFFKVPEIFPSACHVDDFTLRSYLLWLCSFILNDDCCYYGFLFIKG